MVVVGVTKTQSPPDDDGDEAEEEVGVRRTRVIDGRRRLENGLDVFFFRLWEERDGTKNNGARKEKYRVDELFCNNCQKKNLNFTKNSK